MGYTEEGLKTLMEWAILSKPVYKSLVVINRHDPIIRIEGSCGKHKSFFPFSVQFKNGGFRCSPTDIHEYAKNFEGQIDLFGAKDNGR